MWVIGVLSGLPLGAAWSTEALDRELIEAINRASSLSVVQNLVDQGANVNNSGRSLGEPILSLALWKYGADYSVAEYLIEQGADVDFMGRWGTSLSYQVRALDPYNTDLVMAAVRFLFDHGADPNLHVQQSGPPFFQLIQRNRNNNDFVRMFIAQGVDLNAPDEYSHTPLIAYIRAAHRRNNFLASGDFSFVDLLLENGADVNAADRNGVTALMHALSFIRDELRLLPFIRYLVDNGALINLADAQGRTALQYTSLPAAREYMQSVGAHRGTDVVSEFGPLPTADRRKIAIELAVDYGVAVQNVSGIIGKRFFRAPGVEVWQGRAFIDFGAQVRRVNFIKTIDW